MSSPNGFDPPPNSPPRRRRKWLVLGAPVLLLAVFLVAGYFYLLSNAEWGWQGAVAEADRQDPNWRWEDLQAGRRAYADDENAALVVMAAKKLLPQPWPVWYAARVPPQRNPDGPADAAFQEAQADWSRQEEERTALANSFDELQPQHQLSDLQRGILHAEMKKAADALAEARKLTRLPGGRFPIKYSADFISTLMPEIQDARAVVNLLGYDVLLRTQEDDLAGALESCHALFNLCRCFDEEPTLIAMLVRIACRSVALRRLERVLAQGEPAEADLARLQRVLQVEEAVPILLDGFRGERAGGDLLMQALESGQVGGGQAVGGAQLQASITGGAGGVSPWENLLMMLPGGMRHQRTALLRLNNRMVEMAKLPPEKQRAEMEQIVREIPSLSVLARLLGTSQDKVANASWRSLVELRAAIVMLAMERYRRAHGRWPENLAALTPDFFAEVPTDPYDGQPLRLRRLDDGAVIYSVGLDGKDDGGKLSRRQEKGTDHGVRLWDVPNRRQPPQPPKPKVAP